MSYLLETCVLSELAKPAPDALVAATSLEHGLEVVTRNIADLERCGARCVNPWNAAAG